MPLTICQPPEGQPKLMIPAEYHDFLDVFNPEAPLSHLPLPQPEYDFSIEIDPTKPLPTLGPHGRTI